MGQYTDWFLADESEADAIADIAEADSESNFEDWPHLAMKSVLESELMALWGILKGKPGKLVDTTGKTLAQRGKVDEEGIGDVGLTLVVRVLPEFVSALAKLTTAESVKVVTKWLADESMDGWKKAEAAAVLNEMIAFAARAETEGLPVLEMVTV